MKKNKKNLFFKRYGIEIFVVVTIVALLADIETNPENMFAGFWTHIKLYDKISIVAMLILLVAIGHLLRDILKKWFEEYALLVLIMQFTVLLPTLGHKVLFFNDSTLTEADILSFYGTYLTFIGALSLGYVLYKKETKKICGEGGIEAAYLEKGMEEILKKFAHIDYYIENGIVIPTIPQWDMYYNSVAKHIECQKLGLYIELAHFFDTVSKINYAIEAGAKEEASKIYEDFLQYEYYNCGAYNYVEAKSTLKAISNGKLWLKDWIDDESDKICEFQEKYYEVIEQWIFNYMMTHGVGICELTSIERELVDDLLKILEIKRWIPCECEKRRIVYVVENISYDMETKSSILNYSDGVYSLKDFLI